MSRKDALLRLHHRLIARRDSLRGKLSREDSVDQVDVGDLGDVANEGATNELNSQLASIETRELSFIERAIQLMRDGRYGLCEECSGAIPVARLQALPYTVMCVDCQREEESYGPVDRDDVDWDKACDYEIRFSEREITIDDLNLDV